MATGRKIVQARIPQMSILDRRKNEMTNSNAHLVQVRRLAIAGGVTPVAVGGGASGAGNSAGACGESGVTPLLLLVAVGTSAHARLALEAGALRNDGTALILTAAHLAPVRRAARLFRDVSCRGAEAWGEREREREGEGEREGERDGSILQPKQVIRYHSSEVY